MDASSEQGSGRRFQIILAFSAIYLIWGSTYLAIRFAVETIPPFIMAGIRFLTAGLIVLAWMRLQRRPLPGWREWWSASVVGFLLLAVGNGALSWAEQRVPSGVAALIIASIPAMVVVLEFILYGIKPSGPTVVGLVLGSIGTVVLVDPARVSGTEGVDLVGTAVLLVGSFSWAYGSLYSRTAPQASPPLQSTGMQMLIGGIVLLGVGALSGELSDVGAQPVSPLSIASVLYLIVFGSLIAFSSYIWLLRVSTPARVSTGTFVNPIIALVLGWMFAGEDLNVRILLASVLNIVAVWLIIGGKYRKRESGSSSHAADAEG